MSAITIIENALETGQLDAVRKLGSSHVGESWTLVENADWCGIILKEYKASVDTTYMSVKEVKARSKKGGLTYFAQPFEYGNGMKLLEDVHLDKPLGVHSVSDETVTTTKLSSTGRRKNGRTRNNAVEDNDGEGELINTTAFETNEDDGLLEH